MGNDINIFLMPRAAIFGGSFNPPHLGHLIAAQAAIAAADLDRFYWVPTRYPPHKSACGLAPLTQRAYMLRLALADNPNNRVVCEPATASGYAIDTFAFLRDREPTFQWIWLLGLDAFARLPYWYRRQELVPAMTWLVVPRCSFATPSALDELVADGVPPGNALESFYVKTIFERTLAHLHDQGIPIQTHLLSGPVVDISATAIRARYATGQSCAHWVPVAVDRYITETGLYREIL
ncbi:MAG: nicotinate (nicotinamide) nucleotide adenylyltransferase [Cyanobacteria bacterium J06641_5]